MRSAKKKYLWILLLMILFLVMAAIPLSSQMSSSNYQIPSSVLDDGGGQVESPGFKIRDSIGQPTGGWIMKSAGYGIYVGFQPTTLQEFPQWAPHIRLSSDILDFGQVKIGRTTERTVTVYNDGFGVLEISNISCADPVFSPSPGTLNVRPSCSGEVAITFAPVNEETYEDIITFTCNDPECPEVEIAMHGVGIAGCTGGDVGDVNGDASINVLDVLAVVNDILGIVPLDENGKCRADCNGDGSINVLDALGIVNVILDIIPECPGNTAKIAVHPEAMEFLKSLEPYFPPEQFEKFIGLVKEVQIPESFTLEQNYPNPFNPTTAISYQLPAISFPVHTTLMIHNILGQKVAALVDEVREPGYYTVTWDASGMASGVYFYRLTAGDYAQTRRMLLLR